MRARLAAPTPAVAEVQGLYGAFSFPEKLLQKIWLRGDFDRPAAVTTDGTRLCISHPGRWNLLAGPDFIGAKLRLGDEAGPDTMGDVEVHLRAGDWDAHGHVRDPAYDRVALHVVLFPPETGHITRGASGRSIPVLALLPLLHRSLEEFAADEAVETLSNRPLSRLAEEFGRMPMVEIASLLRRYAALRWKQKVHFARLRVLRLGWEAACHHMALEILGYRFNRSAMLRIASRRPLAEWANRSVDGDEAFAAEKEGWSLQGVRPANHPRKRLRQYAAWVGERPDWPELLRALAEDLPTVKLNGGGTREVRRTHGFSRLRGRIADQIFGDIIGGTRLDNLVCDGFLPLLAAHENRDVQEIWHHWFPGDLPPFLSGGLRQVGIFDGRAQPACHGAAQGLLGWLLEREARQVGQSGTPGKEPG